MYEKRRTKSTEEESWLAIRGILARYYALLLIVVVVIEERRREYCGVAISGGDKDSFGSTS